MKQLIIAVAFTLSTSAVFSQLSVLTLNDNVSGKNFNTDKYSGMKGTPFLVDRWTRGSVTTPKGIYADLELKFNVYDNALFYNKNDEAFELIDDIVSFTLKPKPEDPATYQVFKKGIYGADLRETQYVQVLVEGPVNVYKLDQKQLVEMSEINAGVIKTFTPNSKYYIGSIASLTFIKLNKNEVINALKNKEAKIRAYIDEKKFTFRKETDLVEVVKYYNSI